MRCRRGVIRRVGRTFVRVGGGAACHIGHTRWLAGFFRCWRFEKTQTEMYQPQQEHNPDGSQQDALGGKQFKFFALFLTGIWVRCVSHDGSWIVSGLRTQPFRNWRVSPTRMVTLWASKYSAKGITYLRDAPVISLNSGVVMAPLSRRKATRRSLRSSMALRSK